ncbi:MAG: hypothetical protein ABH864_01225 [archaeon]
MDSAMAVAGQQEQAPPVQQPRSKIWIYVMVAVFIVIVVIASVAVVYLTNKQSSKEEVVEAHMTWFRCLSLCPLIPYESLVNDEVVRTVDPSCMYGCNDEGHRVEWEYGYVLYPGPIEEAISQGYLDCFNLARADLDFDHETCYSELFDRYKEYYDFSDYELPHYQVYSLTLDGFTCYEDRLEVSVTYSEGDDVGGNVTVVLEGGDYTTKAVQFDAINVGDSETYVVVYDEQGLDFDYLNGTFSTSLLIQGKGTTLQEWSQC